MYASNPPPSAPPAPGGIATAGMVLGIIAVSLAWIPLLGIVALPLAVLAMVFGGISLYRVHSGKATGYGKPVTAVTTGVVALGIWLLWFLLFAGAAAGA